MKSPSKRELQQAAFNHSSGIEFRHFMSLYKKCTPKPFSFLEIDNIRQIILYISRKFL